MSMPDDGHETHLAHNINRPGCTRCNPAPEHLHYVTITRDPYNERPSLSFECKGSPAAQCHQYPDCACEAWGDGHEHPFMSHEDCWVKDWADVGEGNFVYIGDDADDMHDDGMPDEFQERTGPVTITWEEEWVEWEWAA